MTGSKPQLWWTPPPEFASSTRVAEFIRTVNDKFSSRLETFWDLHRWSIEQPDLFWTEVWEQFGVIGQKRRPVSSSYFATKEKERKGSHDSNSVQLYDASITIGTPKPVIVDTVLNFTENILLSHPSARSKTKIALYSIVEPPEGSSKPLTLSTLTYAQLYDRVRLAAHALKKLGIKKGDVVAAFSPNNAEAVVFLLAAASLGAIFSACPAEFGVAAVLERLAQV
jgi:acetoacetyl-CoA synthetase